MPPQDFGFPGAGTAATYGVGQGLMAGFNAWQQGKDREEAKRRFNEEMAYKNRALDIQDLFKRYGADMSYSGKVEGANIRGDTQRDVAGTYTDARRYGIDAKSAHDDALLGYNYYKTQLSDDQKSAALDTMERLATSREVGRDRRAKNALALGYVRVDEARRQGDANRQAAAERFVGGLWSRMNTGSAATLKSLLGGEDDSEDPIAFIERELPSLKSGGGVASPLPGPGGPAPSGPVAAPPAGPPSLAGPRPPLSAAPSGPPSLAGPPSPLTAPAPGASGPTASGSTAQGATAPPTTPPAPINLFGPRGAGDIQPRVPPTGPPARNRKLSIIKPPPSDLSPQPGAAFAGASGDVGGGGVAPGAGADASGPARDTPALGTGSITPPERGAAPAPGRPNVGDIRQLKDGRRVRIKAVNPDGSFMAERLPDSPDGTP